MKNILLFIKWFIIPFLVCFLGLYWFLLVINTESAYATNLVNINGNAIGSIVNFGGNAVSGINNVDGNTITSTPGANCSTVVCAADVSCTSGYCSGTASTCMVNAETCTARARILGIDSGATINVANIDGAYTLMKDGTNGFSPLQWCAARFAYSISSGSYVSTVYDITSHARDMSGHGTSSLRPGYTANVKNSQPGFDFSGNHSEYFQGGDLGITGANSGFIIAHGASGNVTSGYLFQWGDYNLKFFAIHTGIMDPYYYYIHNSDQTHSLSVTSAIATTSTTFYLWNWKMAATNWHIDNFSDNVTTIGSATSQNVTPGGVSEWVGTYNISETTHGGYWYGDVAEWLILGSEYTSGQYTAITNYENGVWSLW